MRYVAPALLLGFLVFPSWNHKRRPLGKPRVVARLSERDATTGTPSTQAKPSAGSVGGAPALKLVPPESLPGKAAGSPPAAAPPAGGTYTTQLIATSFAQLRQSVFGAHAREQYDKTVALTLDLLNDREDAA